MDHERHRGLGYAEILGKLALLDPSFLEPVLDVCRVHYLRFSLTMFAGNKKGVVMPNRKIDILDVKQMLTKNTLQPDQLVEILIFLVDAFESQKDQIDLLKRQVSGRSR